MESIGDFVRRTGGPEARHLIEVWSGLTGEHIDDSARLLADEYLRRWGLRPAGPSAGDDPVGTARPSPRVGPGAAPRRPLRRPARPAPPPRWRLP